MENVCSIRKRTFWESLLWKLFPMTFLPTPDEDPDYPGGYMSTDMVWTLSWLNRIRILVSGKIKIKLYTKTDVIVNKAHSTSVSYVLPPNGE